MANVIHRPEWHLPERLVTPEKAFQNRRQFLRQLGFTGAGILTATLVGCNKSDPSVQNAVNPFVASPDSTPGVLVKGYPAPPQRGIQSRLAAHERKGHEHLQ